MKVPDETQPVPDETRPVVPIFKAHWPDYGTKTTEEGGTCTSDACNSLVAAGPLAGAYILKKHEMDGDASLPGTMWDSETLQEFRDDPAKMAQNMAYGKPSTDDLQYMMCRNNEVKSALKLWFGVDSITVLSVDADKRLKAGKNARTFVSELYHPFVALISVLQYSESKYTKSMILDLGAQDDVMEFVKESPWILKMPLDYRTSTGAVTPKDARNHKK